MKLLCYRVDAIPMVPLMNTLEETLTVQVGIATIIFMVGIALVVQLVKDYHKCAKRTITVVVLVTIVVG